MKIHHLVSPLPLLLLFSATTNPVSALPFLTKRVSPADLYQDITNIHNGVLANQAAVAAFQGGTLLTSLIEGTPVLATVGAIHLANRKGYADANLSGPIGYADSKRIVDHVVATVGRSIPAAVETIKGKKEAFVAAGQGAVVLASLELLLGDHDSFSAALVGKAYAGDAALDAEAEGVVLGIHDAIQGGIDYYSS